MQAKLAIAAPPHQKSSDIKRERARIEPEAALPPKRDVPSPDPKPKPENHRTLNKSGSSPSLSSPWAMNRLAEFRNRERAKLTERDSVQSPQSPITKRVNQGSVSPKKKSTLQTKPVLERLPFEANQESGAQNTRRPSPQQRRSASPLASTDSFVKKNHRNSKRALQDLVQRLHGL